ncbi:fungal specific transcription factor domain-containing protein [Sarocladium implicatum]|nr:fungal specific transcription factor domain-containing protein [Sarocladium implicatum]
MKVARQRAGWWVRIHKAVRCMSDDPVEPFPDFVRDYYTSDRPSQLGKIAIAYAFTCKEDASHLYALVNRLVVSDMSHMSTVEGLECLILLGTLYSDEGQPRRAWMIFRRGVVAAQLTDLAHASLYSKIKKRLWMSIYRADRMMSLFLGLPYGLNDMHYQQLLESEPDDDYWDAPLTIGVAKLSGKTIDRNLSSSKHSFSQTLQIDEEMDELAATYPDSWWKLPTQLPAGGRYSDEIWTRLHLQMFFFHLRLYIYLPFLSSSRVPAHGSTARLAAAGAARELLRRYLALHSREGGGSLSECKLVDFMAFTAAVVLLLGYSREAGPGPSDADDDTEMISSLIRLLWTQEESERCQIAAQCRKTLMALLSRPGDGEEEVHIPFFGTISRKGIMDREQTPDDDSISQPHQADTGDESVAGLASTAVENSAGYITPHSSVQSGSVNLDLPSDAYWQAPSQVEEFGNMPELNFLYQPENMTGFDAGWDFIMDIDSF